MLAVKGKVTESGAMTAPCTDSGSDEKTFRARHPWSVHQGPFAELKAGMERLRRELPRDGWEIVKDGPDSSTAKSPQLVAESARREFAVDVRLHRASSVGKAPDLLEVTVDSACFRSEWRGFRAGLICEAVVCTQGVHTTASITGRLEALGVAGHDVVDAQAMGAGA
ncbi:hypothetical protein [Streptomyces bacillaris]|uniref:hypothetical protein n=1 Tax=Streptomyces bacillaris TaxID=68179 RepID=UPI0034601BD4